MTGQQTSGGLETRVSWGRRRFLSACLCLAGGGGVTAFAQRSNQYQAHAAVILKFSAYVTRWPDGQAPKSQLTLCVVTRDRETFADFHSLVHGKTIANRTWKVVQARSLTEAIGHHFVYIDGERPEPDDLWYEKAGAYGVLTVGEKTGSKSRRCVIDIDARLGFDIDLEYAKQAGIRLHSDLFEIARSVKRPKS